MPVKLQPAAATSLTAAQIWRAMRQGKAAAVANKFVETLAGRLGMKSGIALSSLMRNTFAAVDATKRRCPPDSSIILPRYACPSFIHGIQASGMPYRYCDTVAETLSVDTAALIKAADESTRAVLIPNLFGLSADMPAIRSLCQSRGWVLIEGADYSLGGEFQGQPLGSFGDYTLLNFQEGKALPIGGGMALSRSEDDFGFLREERTTRPILALARSIAYGALIRPVGYGLFNSVISTFGIGKKQFSMEDTIRKTKNEYDYAVATPRLNEQISSYQSALGLELLTALNSEAAVRLKNAFFLEEKLSGLPSLNPVTRLPGLNYPHYIRYPVLIGGGRRDALCKHLIRKGFEASPMYVEHGMRVDPAVHPGAARICAELLTLPCHRLMSESDLQRLAVTIADFLTS